MEITESIYKGVVEPLYKKLTQAYANRSDHGRSKRGESASSNTLPLTVESADKRKKRYVYQSNNKFKTCLVHGPIHSSDGCTVLGDFGANYSKGESIQYHGNLPIPRETNYRQL